VMAFIIPGRLRNGLLSRQSSQTSSPKTPFQQRRRRLCNRTVVSGTIVPELASLPFRPSCGSSIESSF
jgi:hypothetical protein